jgi:hypothetical protein
VPLCRLLSGRRSVPKQFDPAKAIKILALVLGSPSAGERASARATLDRMLRAHGIDGRDLLPRHYLNRLDDATLGRVNDLLIRSGPATTMISVSSIEF